MPRPDYYVGPNAAQLKVLIRLWRREHVFQLKMARAWRLIGRHSDAAQALRSARYARLKLREYLACQKFLKGTPPGQPIDIA